MNKNDLRIKFLSERKNIPEKDNLIFKKLISLPQFTKAEIVLSYVSKKDEQTNNSEIDTTTFINYCLKNKKVLVPKVEGHEIYFYEILGFNDLFPGTFGILEPKESSAKISRDLLKNSFCVVPALACNVRKHRIGYGKGYYDRFLKNYGGFSAILCYEENILDFTEDEYDLPADIVVTDCKILF